MYLPAHVSWSGPRNGQPDRRLNATITLLSTGPRAWPQLIRGAAAEAKHVRGRVRLVIAARARPTWESPHGVHTQCCAIGSHRKRPSVAAAVVHELDGSDEKTAERLRP